MDERVQKYEQKMTKTLDGFEAELVRFVQDVQIRISLTRSQ